MKTPMTKHFLLLTLLFGACGTCWSLSAHGQTPEPGATVLLDATHPKEAEQAIDAAATARQTDVLFTAMHTKALPVQLYCINRIGTLERVPQARLLARLITDDTIVPRDPAMSFVGSIEILGIWDQIQRSLNHAAYKLLGQTPPVHHGQWSYDERKALASELQAVQ